MEEWLKKLLRGITGDQGMVPTGDPTRPGATPPFVGYPRPNGMPGSVAGQPPLRNSTPAVQATVPVAAAGAPMITRPPNEVPGIPPQTTTPNISTPETQLADALGKYNTISSQDPKLKHNLKNNLMQVLFQGLQGVQRIADPQNAPQGPLVGLGTARQHAKLQQMAPGIQGLEAQVQARAAANKAALDQQNTQSEIKARDYEVQLKEYQRTHPGMEVQTDPGTGGLVQRPKGTDGQFMPVPGTTPAPRVDYPLSTGGTAKIPATQAATLDQQKTEADRRMDFEIRKFNTEEQNKYTAAVTAAKQSGNQKEMDLVSQSISKKGEAYDAQKELDRIIAAGEDKTTEGYARANKLKDDIRTANNMSTQLMNQARDIRRGGAPGSNIPKPKTLSAPGRKAPVSKANDPLGLLN